MVFDYGRGRIDHLEEEISVGGFLERAPERGDEVVRQLADEPDGVDQQERPPPPARTAAHQRIERGEQAVLDEGPGAGEQVENGGFSGVRVANQGYARLGTPTL